MRMVEILRTRIMEDLDSKIAYLAKNNSTKILAAFQKDGSILPVAATVFDILSELGKADPTVTGACVTWVTKIYVSGEFKLEDVSRIREDLTKFFKFRTKIKNKDLNNYRSIDDLYSALEPFSDTDEVEQSNRQKDMAIKKDGVTILIDTSNFKALIPLTQEAACKYGSGTKWCTAAKDNNMFDSYNSKGNLVIILATDGGKIHKFQMQFETDSFMNDMDRPITQSEIDMLSKFEQYKDLLNMLIKKHYHTD